MSIILGIDPGSRRTGYGLLRVGFGSARQEIEALAFGTIHLTDKLSFGERLAELDRRLSQLINQWRPNEMAIENIFLGKNADSAFKLGHARGVCMMLAAKNNLPITEYATRTVKKSLTGSGAADKDQVLFMVEHSLGIKTTELDASDALAVALCRARELELDLKMGKIKPLRGETTT